jgi:dienelactone hydrolase
MKRNLLFSAKALAIAAAATMALPLQSVAQTPKMGGGYKDVITIPVDDPKTKAIAGALFKPAGAGPFPAVIYMSTCAGVDSGEERFVQTTVRDRLLSKGFAMLIVDPYWPRQEWQGVCDRPNAGGEYDARCARDIHAALDVLKALPEIDATRIFAQGVGLGASAALSAIDAGKAAAHKTKLAGAIALSPHCKEDAAPSVPTLILIGDQDLWAPAARCRALARMPNVEVKVYPRVGHAFAMPFGHRAQHNREAAKDAQIRAEAFLDAHTVR